MRSIIAALFQLSPPLLLLLFSIHASAHPPSDTSSPFILALPVDAETLYTQNNNNDTTISSSPPSQTAEEEDSGSSRSAFDLFRRQNCPAGYGYCSAIVQTAACCSTNAVCTLDNVGNPACCPIGSFCTGTIPVPGLATTATAAATVTTNNNALLTSTSGGAIIIISTTTATTTIAFSGTAVATASASATLASFVPNTFFPFPYLAGTPFPNSASCAAAYSACTSDYALCTADLQGALAASGYGVTISAPGGVVVVQTAPPAISLPLASAVSVCGSLSAVACPGSAATCAVYGTAAAVVSGGVERAGCYGWLWGAGLVVAVLGWVL